MKKRIFRSIMICSLLILIIASAFIIIVLNNEFTKERRQELVTECDYIASAIEINSDNYLSFIGKESQTRITLVSADGTVLYDNFTDINTLENHRNRPEIANAFKYGSGESTRLSDTLGEQNYYYAELLKNGNVLRVSITTTSMLGFIKNTFVIILLIVMLAVVTVYIAARIITKKIVNPINKLDLDLPLNNNTYDELSPLLIKMDKQNKKIADQIAELTAKQKEFETITENMSEALIIFGSNKRVLYSNKSAGFLFENSKKNSGYLEISRDAGYIESLEKAFAGESSSGKLIRNSRIYQLSVNPVKGDKYYAAVLFAVDITEKEQSEKMRREFSANVSHELRTPLTAIMGSAEIIQNGIVKQEDIPVFIDKIYSESKRLLTLIEDIIKLSRLDEKNIQDEFKPVDIHTVSEKVQTELFDKAKTENVLLSLEGKSCVVSGLENTLHEMIYNLCNNAITYNKPGGSVVIKTEEENDRIVLSVKDTGIGIAPEHHNRIFERFYRVDKSRSKETGGTGLGLSIVKHGAILHNAEIEIESALGKGTTIKIIFRKK